MRNPIESSPNFREYKSFDKVAFELTARWPSLFVKPNANKEKTIRSLGAKIGQLNRGEPSWWLKRKSETDCLIELLGIDRDELGLHQKIGRYIYALPKFPDFPPLDLMREDYWCIAKPELLSQDQPDPSNRYSHRTIPSLDGWLSSQGFIERGKKLEWLHVTDRTEFELLIRRLDAMGHHQFASHDSLLQAITQDIGLVRNQKPLILAIHKDSSNSGEIEPNFTKLSTDGGYAAFNSKISESLESSETVHLNELVTHRQGAPLLIISQSQLPKLPSEKKNEMTITRKDVNTWAWTFLPDWRYQLTQWLEQRMNKLRIDTLYSSGATKDWLDKFDPSGKWFVSVEDVLVLCQAVSERQEKYLETAGSTYDVNALLSLLFKRDETSLDLVQPLIERRWKRWDLVWEGYLDQQTWTAMANGLCTFEALLAKQLIVRGRNGYDFQRPIVIRLLLRSHLMKALQSSELTAWAPACFDNQRRPLVDAALDAIDIGQLEQIATQLTEAPVSADTLGAGEALFAAIGRRIIREEPIGDELPMLADHVLKQLTWNDGLLYPCSRPLASMSQQLEWICVCWAWSLVPSPGTVLPQNWFFPGWNPTLPQTLPEWLKNLAKNNPSQHWEHMATPIMEFMSVVTRWLARHKTPLDYGIMSTLFNAGLLACAAAGKWDACSDWWWDVLDNPIVEKILKHQVESTDSSVNRRTAQAWWPSLVKHKRKKFEGSHTNSLFGGSRLLTRNQEEPVYLTLLNWVMEQMDKHGDDALTGLDADDRKFLMRHPAGLSTTVKRQLLKSLAKDFPTDLQPYDFVNFFQHYGPETAVEIESYLDNDKVGDEAAKCLWEWAPRKAESLLKKRKTSNEALRRLILASPFSCIGDAVDRLRSNPALLRDKERLDWARNRLPDARQHAQDLILLLHVETTGLVS